MFDIYKQFMRKRQIRNKEKEIQMCIEQTKPFNKRYELIRYDIESEKYYISLYYPDLNKRGKIGELPLDNFFVAISTLITYYHLAFQKHQEVFKSKFAIQHIDFKMYSTFTETYPFLTRFELGETIKAKQFAKDLYKYVITDLFDVQPDVLTDAYVHEKTLITRKEKERLKAENEERERIEAEKRKQLEERERELLEEEEARRIKMAKQQQYNKNSTHMISKKEAGHSYMWLKSFHNPKHKTTYYKVAIKGKIYDKKYDTPEEAAYAADILAIKDRIASSTMLKQKNNRLNLNIPSNAIEYKQEIIETSPKSLFRSKWTLDLLDSIIFYNLSVATKERHAA